MFPACKGSAVRGSTREQRQWYLPLHLVSVTCTMSLQDTARDGGSPKGSMLRLTRTWNESAPLKVGKESWERSLAYAEDKKQRDNSQLNDWINGQTPFCFECKRTHPQGCSGVWVRTLQSTIAEKSALPRQCTGWAEHFLHRREHARAE